MKIIFVDNSRQLCALYQDIAPGVAIQVGPAYFLNCRLHSNIGTISEIVRTMRLYFLLREWIRLGCHEHVTQRREK